MNSILFLIFHTVICSLIIINYCNKKICTYRYSHYLFRTRMRTKISDSDPDKKGLNPFGYKPSALCGPHLLKYMSELMEEEPWNLDRLASRSP